MIVRRNMRCVTCATQARTACSASVKERDALYCELHSLGATFRAKHDKLQEQVRQRGDGAATMLA
jgi:hypothetical protein